MPRTFYSIFLEMSALTAAVSACSISGNIAKLDNGSYEKGGEKYSLSY
jgi:hypothetical protein